MITKRVQVQKIKRPACVDGFEYGIIAANGHLIATMAQKGRKGLDNALIIATGVNLFLEAQNL